jgi:hypothetical protein
MNLKRLTFSITIAIIISQRGEAVNINVPPEKKKARNARPYDIRETRPHSFLFTPHSFLFTPHSFLS